MSMGPYIGGAKISQVMTTVTFNASCSPAACTSSVSPCFYELGICGFQLFGEIIDVPLNRSTDRIFKKSAQISASIVDADSPLRVFRKEFMQLRRAIFQS